MRNLDGLLYLLRTDEERILHGICPLYREIGMRATGGMERQTVISPETRSQSKAETAAETVTTPTHPTETVTAMPIETHKTIANAALKSAVQPPNAQGSMDSDEMRKNFVIFTVNGKRYCVYGASASELAEKEAQKRRRSAGFRHFGGFW